MAAVTVMPDTVDIRYLKNKYKDYNGERVTYTAETRKFITDAFTVTLNDGRKEPKFINEDDKDLLRKHGFVKISNFLSKVHDDLPLIQNPMVYRTDKTIPETEASIKTRSVYFRECEELVKRLTGADEAHFVTHAVRSDKTQQVGGEARSKATKAVEYLTAYATFAHTDFTDEILPGAFKMLTKRGVSVERAKQMDYAFFNIWQPTNFPVETAPLALLDWTSMDIKDVHKVSLGYNVTPKGGKPQETYAPPIAQPTYSKKHRWYYYPNLQLHECLVFTQIDGRPGYPTHSFHTAVKHQLVENPRPRSNVETRILCGFLKAPTSKL